jgi:hypothetical protein
MFPAVRTSNITAFIDSSVTSNVYLDVIRKEFIRFLVICSLAVPARWCNALHSGGCVGFVNKSFRMRSLPKKSLIFVEYLHSLI